MNNIITNQNQANVSLDMFDMMDKAYKFAEIIAKSDIIPDHYKNKPANVFIAVQTAYRMNLDPMLVMQNTYIVSGKLGMNTTFAISLANNSGLFANGIRYRQKGSGQDMEVTAYTNLRKTGEEIAYTFTFRTAQAEGYTRNVKYKSMPELMLRYRAATLLIRTHAPEVMNGMHMIEELEDINSIKSANSKIDNNEETNFASKTDALSSRLSIVTQSTYEEQEPYDIGEPTNLEKLQWLIINHDVSQETIGKWLEKAGVNTLDELDDQKMIACIKSIEEKYANQ